MRVDVAALDRTQFKVLEEEGETLVIPLKDKYRWTRPSCICARSFSMRPER